MSNLTKANKNISNYRRQNYNNLSMVSRTCNGLGNLLTNAANNLDYQNRKYGLEIISVYDKPRIIVRDMESKLFARRDLYYAQERSINNEKLILNTAGTILKIVGLVLDRFNNNTVKISNTSSVCIPESKSEIFDLYPKLDEYGKVRYSIKH
ncbi:hypothetical protein [Brachyspira hampsonii]|uniref:Uncharacterized protein n=1 Tax=Brachyspira hampsonii 30446 TaxID=1289135 RepID=A0A2U4FN26_9SPIR|nr:hypothetical protein [Brachyspira hampsonii]EKV56543.1 hypothetical protein A966_09521 [Brachyspira hampsonii 30446]MBW5391084.1 hypothetical protein [Brachyspira hampsonii]MBW5396017.1 hypothetical protein [Brachyspira hampsonii]OEJ18200.1 hypothetical protein A9495_06250 [Brachyspira hampsonii]